MHRQVLEHGMLTMVGPLPTVSSFIAVLNIKVHNQCLRTHALTAGVSAVPEPHLGGPAVVGRQPAAATLLRKVL